LIELRRFDEAVVIAKKARRQSPSYSASYRCLASAFAHLGRDAEARKAAARAEARQAKEALALVEEAIRKRLLCANPGADNRLTAVA